MVKRKKILQANIQWFNSIPKPTLTPNINSYNKTGIHCKLQSMSITLINQ